MSDIVFSGYGIEISKRSGRFFISYDAGEIVPILKEEEVTAQEVLEAQQSEENAYRVILACQKRAEQEGR